jgi:hypothetical protein
MSHGDILNNELEFKEHLKKMTPDEKVDFIAMEMFYQRGKIDRIESNCTACLPTGRQKLFNISGVAGLITAIIIGVIDAFRRM